MSGPVLADTDIAVAQPNTSYTVRCYTDGDTVPALRGPTSSPQWALIADPSNPGTTLGYLPAVSLDLTEVTGKTSDCTTAGFLPPKPKPKQTEEKGTQTQPKQ